MDSVNYESVTVPMDGDGEFRIALRANQTAGFVTVPSYIHAHTIPQEG